MRMSAKWDGYKEWQQSERMWQEKVVSMTLAEVERTALAIERDAKLLVPVDTGKLRNSIDSNINKSKTSIDTDTGTDVAYGPAVEFGTSKQGAQSYLLPSFDKNVGTLSNTLNEILRG